jgi:hypothetical protein
MIARVKHAIKSMPVVGPFLADIRHERFASSADYWERRYQKGGTSGAGSYNHLAEFKAEFLNAFVAEHHVASVIEFGSGDGAQLRLATTYGFRIFRVLPGGNMVRIPEYNEDLEHFRGLSNYVACDADALNEWGPTSALSASGV